MAGGGDSSAAVGSLSLITENGWATGATDGCATSAADGCAASATNGCATSAAGALTTLVCSPPLLEQAKELAKVSEAARKAKPRALESLVFIVRTPLLHT